MNKKIRKILFLDIDGVLNSEKWVNYCHENHIGYNKDVYGQDRELNPVLLHSLTRLMRESTVNWS